MDHNPVVWFEIYVSDMQRARAFYETVLAIKMTTMNPPAVGDVPSEMLFFPAEMNGLGAAGALVRMDGVPVGANSTIVYFGSQDCAIEAGRATKAGGKIVKDKTSIMPYGHFALISDTEGNVIGLHSMN
jgi:predicted enzyme related to lactoylglutathione lyase